MQNFMMKPDISLYPGVRVDKDTVLEYKTDNVEQTVKDLVLHSVVTVKGNGFEGVNDTTIYLKEGDILLFEDGERGYIKPVEPFVTIGEAIEDLSNIKELG